MKLLLDTHVLLWSLDQPERLGKARSLVADRGNLVLVSAVSLWEISVKRRAGKMTAELQVILDALATLAFHRIGIEDAHLRTLLGLPFLHRDPFDHLLIAQALSEGAAFVTADRAIMGYPVEVIAAG